MPSHQSAVSELVLDEHPEVLAQAIADMLANRPAMKRMGDAFLKFAHPNAARDMADMIVLAAKRK